MAPEPVERGLWTTEVDRGTEANQLEPTRRPVSNPTSANPSAKSTRLASRAGMAMEQGRDRPHLHGSAATVESATASSHPTEIGKQSESMTKT